MALIGNTWPTLADLAKSMDPNGMIANAINMLSKDLDILDDVPWIEGNLPTGHRTTLLTALPTVYWRRINEGVLPSKASRAQIDETCAMMEAWSEVDEKLLQLYGNQGAAFRASEDATFVEAMGQELATTLIYGNQAAQPTKFTGLATRYNDVNYGETGSGLKDGAVIDAGGTGSDNTSIWLVVWGERTIHGIYPKGMPAGFQSQDLGRETKVFTDGSLMRVWRSKFEWNCGIAVRDWRYIVRIANIDVSNLTSESGAADLIELMIRAIERIPNIGAGRPVFYVNRVVSTMLRIQALAKTNYTMTFEDIFGRKVMAAQGIPVRRIDQILNTEAQLT